ncbi:unnamed protein product [Protopolystoma xenopodis]|uniref:Uncharacterized protein n=1 Tax=Protopolystoma xenopodis TaxID=117903 RepID=A0A448XG05_9PLAT|nr:unnamed protein product [Protopolystoma xenopodis]
MSLPDSSSCPNVPHSICVCCDGGTMGCLACHCPMRDQMKDDELSSPPEAVLELEGRHDVADRRKTSGIEPESLLTLGKSPIFFSTDLQGRYPSPLRRLRRHRPSLVWHLFGRSGRCEGNSTPDWSLFQGAVGLKSMEISWLSKLARRSWSSGDKPPCLEVIDHFGRIYHPVIVTLLMQSR